MSKVASSVVLGGQERRFKRNVDSQVQDGFRYGHGWSHSVLHIRYIDDILLASTIYCHHCLAFATTRIYTVPCDISEASSNTLVWLDMKLFWTLVRWASIPSLCALLHPGMLVYNTYEVCFWDGFVGGLSFVL